jgi:hypothetical protein
MFYDYDEIQKIKDFIGEDVFYGIEDYNIIDDNIIENFKKNCLKEELYHKE